MNYLLDTHAFLWWCDAFQNLSPTVDAILKNKSHNIYRSQITIWELQIKSQLGKLSLPKPLSVIVATQLRTNHFRLLSIKSKHIYNLGNLPSHHRDPFDRLLISQTMIENLTILSQDTEIAKYPVKIIW